MSNPEEFATKPKSLDIRKERLFAAAILELTQGLKNFGSSKENEALQQEAERVLGKRWELASSEYHKEMGAQSIPTEASFGVSITDEDRAFVALIREATANALQKLWENLEHIFHSGALHEFERDKGLMMTHATARKLVSLLSETEEEKRI